MQAIMRRVRPWIALAVVLALPGPAFAGRGALVREQRTVWVDGARETWRLVWQNQPHPICAVTDLETSITCPCIGVAYGQAGRLALVRLQGGRQIDRLDLGGIFEDFDGPGGVEAGEIALQLHPLLEQDLRRKGLTALRGQVSRRPVTRIIAPADYNHDGQATEFLLQVGVAPCGKRQFAAIGVSKENPRLHVLGSMAHPDEPLVMPKAAWDALVRSPTPAPVLIWECEDHGSEVRSLLDVSARNGRIRAVDRDYGCESAGTAGRLIQSTEW